MRRGNLQDIGANVVYDISTDVKRAGQMRYVQC